MPERSGLVSLVGAGPGDPGLLTQKGLKRIAEADLIVYDQLVSGALIALAPSTAELRHRRSVDGGGQDAITAFLVREGLRGRRVVRLKGGDPFVFGRGAEEAAALADAGVPFEVVPGVSSGIGVPSYAGIPLTHRDHSSSVTFVTGHEASEKPESAIDWSRLVMTGGTLVVFMGVRRLSQVVASLSVGGAPLATPVCAVMWGTTCRQRTVVATLETIEARVEAAALEHPALIIVGQTVALREQLSWFERRPLWGRRVLVTRASAQAPALVEALQEAGAEPVLLPVLEIQPPTDPSFLTAALERLVEGAFDWVILSSVNAVNRFWAALWARGLDWRTLGDVKVAAVGPATREALARLGLRPDRVPEDARAEGLLAALTAEAAAGARFLIPRAEVARNLLSDGLWRLGGVVDVVPIYRTGRPECDAAEARRRLLAADTVTFMSPSSVKNLIDSVGSDAVALLRERTLAAIGKVTAGALTQRGLPPTVTAERSTVAGLVEALSRHATVSASP